MSFPSKADREKCWASRDDFWKCLDDHSGSSEVCSKFREMYENSCPSQWVKHFDRKREYLKFKDRIVKEGSRNSSNLSSISGGGGGGDGEEGGVGRRILPDLTERLTGSGMEEEDGMEGRGIQIQITESRSDLLPEDGGVPSTTKIPSPRIFRRFQTFQPPTYS